MTLFTPLQRRLYRKPIRLTGAEVFKFLNDLFEERLTRHAVALEATPRFKRYGFTGFPSTFYPVFVNLVDNGVFWLRQSAKPRTIRLDVDGDRMVIANSGPPIAARDREAIFELGFTRKPGGRGLGLHISREVLRKEGYSLDLVEPPASFGVAFQIQPAPEEGIESRRKGRSGTR